MLVKLLLTIPVGDAPSTGSVKVARLDPKRKDKEEEFCGDRIDTTEKIKETTQKIN